jgi:hypothetical protein
MNIPVHATIAVLALALAAPACTRHRETHGERERPMLSEEGRRDPNREDQAGVTTLTGASWVANDAAIDRLVASRCAREITCSNIGADRPFTSGEVCVEQVRKKLTEDLHTSECPAGIDGKELDECLDAIRNESCSSPIDTIARLAACRTSDLCMKAEMPHR